LAAGLFQIAHNVSLNILKKRQSIKMCYPQGVDWEAFYTHGSSTVYGEGINAKLIKYKRSRTKRFSLKRDESFLIKPWFTSFIKPYTS